MSLPQISIKAAGHGRQHGEGSFHACGHEHATRAGQEARGAGWRLGVAFWVTAAFMGAEIAVGHWSRSVALTADGWHMASHAVALGVALYAHRHARAFASDPTYCLGTGKVSSLAGFGSSVALLIATLGMTWEAVERWLDPHPISFPAALTVAALGLVLNLVTALVLDTGHHHHAEAGQAHGHHDHNLHAAYLHVLADAVTSLLAIVALLGSRFWGLLWLDPLVALIGAGVVLRWAVGLMQQTARVLLDRAADPAVVEHARQVILQVEGLAIDTLLVWAVGPSRYAAHVRVVACGPLSSEPIRQALSRDPRFAHVLVEFV